MTGRNNAPKSPCCGCNDLIVHLRQGATGATGISGITGTTGSTGPIGATGPAFVPPAVTNAAVITTEGPFSFPWPDPDVSVVFMTLIGPGSGGGGAAVVLGDSEALRSALPKSQHEESYVIKKPQTTLESLLQGNNHTDTRTPLPTADIAAIAVAAAGGGGGSSGAAIVRFPLIDDGTHPTITGFLNSPGPGGSPAQVTTFPFSTRAGDGQAAAPSFVQLPNNSFILAESESGQGGIVFFGSENFVNSQAGNGGFPFPPGWTAYWPQSTR